ncbi:MAG: hypothetical protein COA78_22355 [Blastopirellula sp.]|nr:MAG: hypothetical protein COA78_22355 [Blastopirellula sp.]
MKTYLILLRGVNVGGKNLLPMKELRSVLESGGFADVRTYIQSGNVVLQSASQPEKTVQALLESEFGLTPEIHVLTEKKFHLSVTNNPYQEHEGKFVHFYFCKNKPKANTAKLEQLAATTENYQIIDNVFYLHAAHGIGRSKLAANVEACLGVSTTARNLNTINKLVAMLKN